MKKRFLNVLLTLVMAVNGICTFTISAEDGIFTEGYYTYIVNYGCAEITYVDSNISGDVTIPSELGGYTVTSIGNSAFRNCASLTNITIPDSVTSIGEDVFYDCYSLTNISIPDSVTAIGNSAFRNCASLTNINIPDGVTSIGNSAFNDCFSLTNISIPDSVTSIGNSAFNNCDSLTNITIPDSVTSIDNYAFYSCNSLTDIHIPDSVTSIGHGAFSACDSLTNISIPDSVTSIGERAFSVCYGLTNITIPDSVTSIGDHAFYNCANLTNITIPDSVTSIGGWAFSVCYRLTNINIPDSVTSIGNYAFNDCFRLTNINIPDSVTSIGKCAFADCDSLANIIVEDNNPSYASIDGNLFNKYKTILIQYAIGKNDTLYTIPYSVTSIGECAFSDCNSLTNINIPDSVTAIGERAFADCFSLTTVHYSGSEEQWNAIDIGVDNELLTNANIIFNSTGDVEEAPEIITSFGSKVSEWAAPEIEIAFEKGLIPEIMIGYDLTKKVNRGEFASIALQLYETLIDSSVELPENCAFTDINGDINEDAIKKAYETQIAAGMSENQYMPLEFINREQLATMLCRVIKKRWFNGWTLATDEEYHLDTTGVDAFADDIDISLWAKPSVYYMSKHGIIAGVGDNKFAPRMTPSQQHIADYASATREQALVLSLRIFNKSETGETNWQ